MMPGQALGLPEEFLVLGVGAGKPALDVVDAEAVQGARDVEFVGDREGDALGLGAIAQGRV